MADISIFLENVSKKYRIYSYPQDRLREIIGLRVSAGRVKEVQALAPISVEIRKGEFCGVIGRNGAGKSTLLKLIAGQSTPSGGTLKVVGTKSLLRLGVGFNPEITGRDNVYNSLRYSRLDPNISEDLVQQVIEFSELGDFINFPIKTYSSGMYSRLAFATAVVGDPDILIADEVLAVGDINFSQKCLAKMREFKQLGKTIIFVTHDLNSVRVFCDRAILLEHGRLLRDGDPQSVCEEYRNLMLYQAPADSAPSHEPTSVGYAASGGQLELASGGTQPESPDVHDAKHVWRSPSQEKKLSIVPGAAIQAVRLYSPAGDPGVIVGGSPTRFECLFSLRPGLQFHSSGITLHDDRGLIILHLNSALAGFTADLKSEGETVGIGMEFQMPYLKTGQYSASYSINTIANDEEGKLAIKYDFDLAIEIRAPDREGFSRQGGIVMVDNVAIKQLSLSRGLVGSDA